MKNHLVASRGREGSQLINPHRLFHGVWLPQWPEERPEVSEKAKKLYAYLTYFAGGKGYAWPSFNHLAERLHISRRYVIKLVQELSAHRLITATHVDNTARGHCTNHYRFLWHSWMQTCDDGRFRMVVREKTAQFPTSESDVSSTPPSEPQITTPGELEDTSPGEPQITPLVIPSSPKENNRKRINIRGKVPATSSITSPSEAPFAASPPPRALWTRRKLSSNGESPNCEWRSPPSRKAATRQRPTSFMANSLPTKRLLDSHRMIRPKSPRPLERKNPAILPPRPFGPHPRRSGEHLTRLGSHWGGRSKDENLRARRPGPRHSAS